MEILKINNGEWMTVENAKEAAKKVALAWWQEGGWRKFRADFPRIETATAEPVELTVAEWAADDFEVDIDGETVDYAKAVQVKEEIAGDTVLLLAKEPKGTIYTMSDFVADFLPPQDRDGHEEAEAANEPAEVQEEEQEEPVEAPATAEEEEAPREAPAEEVEEEPSAEEEQEEEAVEDEAEEEPESVPASEVKPAETAEE